MTDTEKNNVRKMMADWAELCISHEAYPSLLLAMKAHDEVMLFRAGEYTSIQIAHLLQVTAKSMILQ